MRAIIFDNDQRKATKNKRMRIVINKSNSLGFASLQFRSFSYLKLSFSIEYFYGCLHPVADAFKAQKLEAKANAKNANNANERKKLRSCRLRVRHEPQHVERYTYDS
jgi:hypothetical protein